MSRTIWNVYDTRSRVVAQQNALTEQHAAQAALEARVVAQVEAALFTKQQHEMRYLYPELERCASTHVHC